VRDLELGTAWCTYLSSIQLYNRFESKKTLIFFLMISPAKAQQNQAVMHAEVIELRKIHQVINKQWAIYCFNCYDDHDHDDNHHHI